MRKIISFAVLLIMLAATAIAENSDPITIGAREQNGKLTTGEYQIDDNRVLSVEDSTNDRHGWRFKDGNQSANTSMNITKKIEGDKAILNAQLSNGKNADIKVMPSTASDRAIERLGLNVCSPSNGCTIELKEVGKGDNARAAYEVQAEKQVRVIGIFKANMRVIANVDAETGTVIKTSKPWWAFLASSGKIAQNKINKTNNTSAY